MFYDADRQRAEELRHEGMNVPSSIEEAIRSSDVSIICVPTPTINNSIDLSFVRSVVTDLGECLKEKNGPYLVVVKSTVIPTTTEKVIIPILREHSQKEVGKNQIGVCVNPEFMTEIHGSWTQDGAFSRGFLDEPVIVIGESDKQSGDLLERIYRPLDRPVIRTDLTTAEMTKYAFNCALATRISYWNEIYYICRILGVDSGTVARAASMDSRIGRYGTVHGKAFGGKCLPKDLRALVQFAVESGYEPRLLRAVEEMNRRIAHEKGVRE
jgi:UDPglucose 6-dehydrogenase